jgi:hypothetical protein
MAPIGLERIADTLTWQAAVRSDLSVARLMLSGEDPDGLYGLGHARIVDAFFCWLDDLGVLDALRALPVVGVKRKVIPPELYVLIYFLRCLARIPSQEALPDLLFSDSALMQRLGFNAHQLEYGITRRSEERRQGRRRNLPVDPEAVSKNVVKLDLDAVRQFVHLVLQKLWARLPEVPARVLGAIDGTFIDLGPSAKGAKTTMRTKQVRTRDGMRTVDVATTGFKMVWMWCPETGLPLAVAFGTAEVDERPFVEGLILQARAVLGLRGKLDTVVIDRGFISGPGLWKIDEMGVRFVIPAKHDMNVYDEARQATRSADPGLTTHRKSRTRNRRARAGKGEPLRDVAEVIEVVGVEGCLTFETYAPAEEVGNSGHKDRNKKSFTPNPINAVALTREDGRKNPDLVLLTNGPVRQPFGTFDDYDERSRIENQGHRELKQSWFIEHPVQRTAKAAELHVLFVVLAYGLTEGYRQWLDGQIRDAAAGRTTTLGKFNRNLIAENHDRVIVFIGEQYGIYYTSELAMLFGRRVRKPNPKGAATVEELLDRLERTAGEA